MKQKIKLSDFNDYAKNRLGTEDYQALKAEAALEADIYRSLQNQFSHLVQEYMVRENKGFNDVVKEFELSQTQVSKILRGSGNFTFATLAHVFAAMGKMPKLIQQA